MGKEDKELSGSPADTGAQQGKGETVAVPKTVFGRDAQGLQGPGIAEEQGSRNLPGIVFDSEGNAQVPGAVAKRMADLPPAVAGYVADLQHRAEAAEAKLERQRELTRVRNQRHRQNEPDRTREQAAVYYARKKLGNDFEKAEVEQVVEQAVERARRRQAVREWAKGQGLNVGSRGPVSAAIFEQYDRAQAAVSHTGSRRRASDTSKPDEGGTGQPLSERDKIS